LILAFRTSTDTSYSESLKVYLVNDQGVSTLQNEIKIEFATSGVVLRNLKCSTDSKILASGQVARCYVTGTQSDIVEYGILLGKYQSNTRY
jgi:hypothetical protein